jgi:hypothetical protein
MLENRFGFFNDVDKPTPSPVHGRTIWTTRVSSPHAPNQ